MCAIFGFLNYGKKIKPKILKKLVRNLSIACEVRGTDATGISYIKNRSIKTFKQPKPAHELNLYFPKDTTSLIGHTRYTTQGSEKFNQNNHPFTSVNGFSLAHNGVIYNDMQLREQYQLPQTNIETDSYVAVQLLDYFNQVDFKSIKFMAENLQGSFAITILKNDNTLYLVKGSNPIYLIHFQSLGLYLYSSTEEIMFNALMKSNFNYKFNVIKLLEGDILSINSMGIIEIEHFKSKSDYLDYFDNQLSILLDYCSNIGVDDEDIYLLLDYGLEVEEIEYIINDIPLLEHTLKLIKSDTF